jgi:hypothetical protein
MVNEEIVGGLKNALDRGSSLQKAMMTFFNAGYGKKEIEEAAAVLLNYSPVKKETTPLVPVTKEVKPEEKKENKKTEEKKENTPPQLPNKKNEPIKENNFPKLPPQKVVQKVSQYGEEKQDKEPKIPNPPWIKNANPSANPKTEKQIQKKEEKTKKSSSRKGIIIALVILLVFLIGILISIFLFRAQIIDLLSSILT